MKDYNLRPSTVYVPTGSCPGKFARRQPHNFKHKVPVRIQIIIKIIVYIVPIITLGEFRSSSPFTALYYILPITD